MEKINKVCQSCGMPLKRDEKGGGTNAHRSISIKYCSHCYVDGNFTSPNMTVKEMQDRVKMKLMEAGIPGFLTGIFTIGIPKLDRWKKQ